MARKTREGARDREREQMAGRRLKNRRNEGGGGAKYHIRFTPVKCEDAVEHSGDQHVNFPRRRSRVARQKEAPPTGPACGVQEGGG